VNWSPSRSPLRSSRRIDTQTSTHSLQMYVDSCRFGVDISCSTSLAGLPQKEHLIVGMWNCPQRIMPRTAPNCREQAISLIGPREVVWAATPLANELKKSNSPRAKQRDKKQADPKCCWPCAEPLWSYHAHKPCKECGQTAYEQYNETERFDTNTVKVHTALCA
jgi:hypothetical protein